MEKRLEEYRRNGVIRVEGLLNDEQLTEIRSALERYQKEILPGVLEQDFVMEKDGQSVRNQWRMERYDAFFKTLSERKDILDLIEPLVNGRPACKGVETFNKPAKTGSGVPPHQDNAYFCAAPPDVLTLWIAIDPVTKANGPVCYLKGSHVNGTRPHKKSGVAGNSMGLSDPLPKDEYEEFRGTLNPGDALLHHCETIHWSAANKTDQSRCGLLMVYRGEHTKEDQSLKKAYTS